MKFHFHESMEKSGLKYDDVYIILRVGTPIDTYGERLEFRIRGNKDRKKLKSYLLKHIGSINNKTFERICSSKVITIKPTKKDGLLIVTAFRSNVNVKHSSNFKNTQLRDQLQNLLGDQDGQCSNPIR